MSPVENKVKSQCSVSFTDFYHTLLQWIISLELIVIRQHLLSNVSVVSGGI
jgi:hypothetical protein